MFIDFIHQQFFFSASTTNHSHHHTFIPHTLKLKHIPPPPPLTLSSAELENLNEQTLLEELKVRFSRDVIYTYVGEILVTVNPFKWIDGEWKREGKGVGRERKGVE